MKGLGGLRYDRSLKLVLWCFFEQGEWDLPAAILRHQKMLILAEVIACKRSAPIRNSIVCSILIHVYLKN